MDVLNNNISYGFWDFKGSVDYVDSWFLMRKPGPVLVILVSYLSFVLKIGPNLMKSRQPFKFDVLILVYNIFQVLQSCYIAYSGTIDLWHRGLIQQYCFVDDATTKYIVASGIYMFFMAKLSELIETIFFVLRKKQSQVTFLHVFHHSSMLSSTWMTLKYEPTYSVIFLGTLNAYVHIVMYTYYALSSFPMLTKYLWWKKYITLIQIIQFVIDIIQVLTCEQLSNCKSSFFILSQVVVLATIDLYAFSKFYIQTYVNNKRKALSEKNE